MLEVDWSAVVVAVLAIAVVALLVLLVRWPRKPRGGLSEDGLELTLTPEQWESLMRTAKRTAPGEQPRP